MNSVTARSSSRAGRTRNNHNRPNKSVETAGSLAMLGNRSWFSNNMYDSFISSNPFSVDYSRYANFCNNDGSSVAYSGFFGSLSNVMSTLGSSDGGASFLGGGSDGAGCGASGGVSGGASCGGCSGGFVSVC